MRKILSMILAVLLLLGLFSGCDEEAEPTEETTLPAGTTASTEMTTTPEEETEATLEATEAAAEDSATPEDDGEGEESPLNTVVLRSEDVELNAQYILLAVNSEGPFHSEDIMLNEVGADALIQWLMTAEAQEIVANFGTDVYGEPVFTLPEDVELYRNWIPNATEDNQVIHMVVSDILNESGLLDALFPVFEETYGYTVEVQTTSASGALTTAKLGIFDLVLTEKTEAAQTFITDGYARVVDGFEAESLPLCGNEYLLCGPKDDPAGAADCASLTEAFEAIGEGGYLFLSRGDSSSVHKLEQSIWPADQEFGDWYISVDTEMGPLLVMNEVEGGYVLTDKLTWLQFFREEGII